MPYPSCAAAGGGCRVPGGGEEATLLFGVSVSGGGRTARGGSWPGSSPRSTVVDPAGFRQARASWGGWAGEGLRRPKGISLPSFSHSWGSALFSSLVYSSHFSPGELRGVFTSEEVSAGAGNPLVFSASGRRRAAALVGTVAFRPLQSLLRNAFSFAALPTHLLLMFAFTPFSFWL